MSFKSICKAQMAGMLFPGILLPIVYLIFSCCDSSGIENIPYLKFVPMFIPLLFGLANVIHIANRSWCPIKNENCRLWCTGGALGVVVSLVGVFVLDVPVLLFGLSGVLEYLPIIIVPIIYGAIFRYIVHWLNSL